MNPYEMVAVIVIVVMIARVLRDRYRHQAMTPPMTDDMRIMADELARLRERVQVLERVITDDHSGHDLAARIERLRDQ